MNGTRTENVGVMVEDSLVVCRVESLRGACVLDSLLAPRLGGCVEDVYGKRVGRIGIQRVDGVVELSGMVNTRQGRK